MSTFIRADQFGDFASLAKTFPLLYVYDNVGYSTELVKPELYKEAYVWDTLHYTNFRCSLAVVVSIRRTITLTTLSKI
jgi:hypothetical protein